MAPHLKCSAVVALLGRLLSTDICFWRSQGTIARRMAAMFDRSISKPKEERQQCREAFKRLTLVSISAAGSSMGVIFFRLVGQQQLQRGAGCAANSDLGVPPSTATAAGRRARVGTRSMRDRGILHLHSPHCHVFVPPASRRSWTAYGDPTLVLSQNRIDRNSGDFHDGVSVLLKARP